MADQELAEAMTARSGRAGPPDQGLFGWDHGGEDVARGGNVQ